MSVPKNYVEVKEGFIQRGDYLIEKQPNSACDEDIWQAWADGYIGFEITREFDLHVYRAPTSSEECIAIEDIDAIDLFEKFREVKHPKSLIVQQLSVEFVEWVREQQKR